MQMASRKEYAYQIRGNQISLVEKDFTNLDDGLNYTYSPGDGINIPSGGTLLKSPLTTVTNGLEIEYVYSPDYHINNLDDTKAITAYTEADGLLSMTVASMSATADDWVLIRGSDRWNGLHQVNATISSQTTIVFKTKYNGGAVTESSTLYIDIDVLNDESDTIDLPQYLNLALVYYVKARFLEDARDIEGKEYYMREFRKMVEKHNNAKVTGPRRVMPGSHAIR
jgi:hypothetical protein